MADRDRVVKRMFTDEDRRRILAEARANIERPTPKFAPRSGVDEWPLHRSEPVFTDPAPAYRLIDAE
jgi:hypothetical protein